MCGIVALNTNTKIVKQTLLDSLSIMEYRGYDSAGMTLKSDDTLKTIKAVGKVVNLSNKANEYDDSEIEIGIAHTR